MTYLLAVVGPVNLPPGPVVGVFGVLLLALAYVVYRRGRK